MTQIKDPVESTQQSTSAPANTANTATPVFAARTTTQTVQSAHSGDGAPSPHPSNDSVSADLTNASEATTSGLTAPDAGDQAHSPQSSTDPVPVASPHVLDASPHPSNTSETSAPAHFPGTSEIVTSPHSSVVSESVTVSESVAAPESVAASDHAAAFESTTSPSPSSVAGPAESSEPADLHATEAATTSHDGGASNVAQSPNEDRALYEKNFEFEQSIKNTEANKMPLVCLPESIQNLYKEYENGSEIFRHKIAKLAEKHQQFRRCRGDGNCFYRAFVFAWFECLLLSRDRNLRESALRSFASTKPILEKAKYASLVFEDIYDIVFKHMKDVIEGQHDRDTLLSIFQSDEVSNSIVLYLRLVVGAYLKLHASEYEPFLEVETDMEEYCRAVVEVMDQEADHIHITALTKALGVAVEIAYMSGSSALEEVNFHEFAPDPSESGTVPMKPLMLLYRPGHYDILYRTD